MTYIYNKSINIFYIFIIYLCGYTYIFKQKKLEKESKDHYALFIFTIISFFYATI